ncbi:MULTISPECIES: cell wall-binding repeat-containing protein [Clostridium]|jgi:putative cell wall-binding protein|uniref:Cell wall-binding repeat-containing protein n=1 Tax=Clostridium lapidicellarium TaxID=3240931 RepID=A0ABV4DV70_9CLOT|nr:cell wall-binding repeat-containing protein [uncultured Clostridium sp.]
MKKIFSKLIVCLFTTSIAVSGFAVDARADAAPSANSGVSVSKNRIYGSDRIETSLKISQEGWKDGSDTVVIAQGYGYADALCAAPLAKKYNAPVILSRQDSLDENTINELKRLKAANAFVIGGTASLSDNVISQLENIGIKPERLGGRNRYETSVEIARKLGDSGNISNIVVASGAGYADSLSIAPIAASKGMPILLSERDVLPDATSSYIKGRNISKTYVIGGTASISDSLETSLPNAQRIGGATRFATNLAILQNFKSDLNFKNVYIAEGDGPAGNEFADALSGSVLAARESAPMVLIYKDISDDTASFIVSNMEKDTALTALGGTIVVPDTILTKIVDLYEGKSPVVSSSLSAAVNKILSDGNLDDWQALAVARYGASVPSSYLTNLSNSIAAAKGNLSKPTDYERITLALMAVGQDPANFQGYNLIEKIYNNTGIDDQGINAYVFALIALDSGNFETPSGAVWTRDKLIDKILENKTADNGWSYAEDSADPDMTGMALIALAPYRDEAAVKDAVDKAVDKLSSMQDSDGGFSSYNVSNSESISQVIMGLCANGIDPASAAFTKNGKTALDALLSFEVPGGGFGHTKDSGYNAMATEQAVQALEAYNMFESNTGTGIYKFK